MSRVARITIDPSGWDELKDRLSAFKYEIQDAMREAAKKTTRWANNEGISRIVKLTGVRRAVVKGRTAVKFSYQDGKGNVWFGFNPISLSRLRPRQTRKGVTAGKVKRPGTFIVQSLNGQVFKRRGPGRLPLDKQMLDIHEEGGIAVEQVIDRIEARFRIEFSMALGQTKAYRNSRR